MTELGHRVMGHIAESLELDAGEFGQRFLADPFVLFRIFNYPPAGPAPWGVGEHTDYGLLTILKQSDEDGLEVKTRRGWIDAPPLPGTFLCNIGDMLERMTLGLYRSTPHRVRHSTRRDRLSLPFFFDPSFDAELPRASRGPRASRDSTSVHPLATDQNRNESEVGSENEPRWDGRSVFDFHGTYGEYLLEKVSRVFPELARQTLA